MSGFSAKSLAVFALAFATILAGILLYSREPKPPVARLEPDEVPAVVELPRLPLTEHSERKPAYPNDHLVLLSRGLPIEGCDKPVGVAPEIPPQEEQRASLTELSEKLSHSGDPELLLASALMNPDALDRWQLLDRVLAATPQNPVALWQQLQYCDQMDCNRKAVESAAATFDESNGMVWLEIGSARIRAGQWREAEEALRRAVTSPRFDTYFINHALLIERGLAATTEQGYQQRIVHGIGVAAAMAIPSFGDISRACKSGENDARLWQGLCRDLGERMSDVGNDMITVMIGIGYHKAAARRAGDDEVFEQLSRRSKQWFDELMRAQAEAGAQVLMQNDPAVLQHYVENFLAHGELVAMGMLVEDARRLRDDPNYDQCNFVGNTEFDL